MAAHLLGAPPQRAQRPALAIQPRRLLLLLAIFLPYLSEAAVPLQVRVLEDNDRNSSALIQAVTAFANQAFLPSTTCGSPGGLLRLAAPNDPSVDIVIDMRWSNVQQPVNLTGALYLPMHPLIEGVATATPLAQRATIIQNLGLHKDTATSALMSFLKTLGWTTVKLLTERCSWIDLTSEEQVSLQSAAAEHEIEVFARGFNLGTQCLSSGFNSRFIWLVLADEANELVQQILNLYNAGHLEQGHVFVFPSDLSPISVPIICESLLAFDHPNASKASAFFEANVISFGTFPGSDSVQSALDTIADTADIAPLTWQPYTSRSALIIDAILYSGRIAQLVTCHSNSHLTASMAPFVEALVRYSNRPGRRWDSPIESEAETPHFFGQRPPIWTGPKLIMLINSDGEQILYSPTGARTWRPWLMLNNSASLYPVPLIPVDINIIFAFGRQNPAVQPGVAAAEAFAIAALEFFTEHRPQLRLLGSLRDTYSTSCSGVAREVVDGNVFHALAGGVISECTVQLANITAPANMLTVSPGATVASLSNTDIYASFFRLNPSSPFYGTSVARWLQATQFDCASMIVDPSFLANVEAGAAFQAESQRIGIATEAFYFNNSASTAGMRAMLEDVWRAGSGVIVVMMLAAQANILLEVARVMGMFEENFLWVFSSFAAIPTTYSPQILQASLNKVVMIKVTPPAFTTQVSKDYLNYFSTTGHQAFVDVTTARPYTVGFADAVNVISYAAVQRLHTYQFGANVTATRIALVEGVSDFLINKTIDGIAYSQLSFDEKHNVHVSAQIQVPNIDASVRILGLINDETVDLNMTLWKSLGSFSCVGPSFPTTTVDPAAVGAILNESKGISLGGILGIALGIALLLALLVVMLLLVRRRNKGDYEAHDFKDELSHLESLTPLKGLVVPDELPRHRIVLGEEVGSGAFGSVHEGVLRMPSTNQRVRVAVKTLRNEGLDNTVLEEFYHEATMLAQFANEPRIVSLLGVVTLGRPLLMVMELCEKGALDECLRSYFFKDQELSWVVKLRMAAEVADGMSTVALAGGLHRDLAARNVLVTEDMHCKIADFGMSKDRRYYMTKGNRLVPVRWAAPEVLKDQVYSTASDVWSFGVLMYEMAMNAASLPYASMSNPAVLIAVSAGYRLERPPTCPLVVYDIMRSCWLERHERPSFSELYVRLREVQRLVNAEQISLDPVRYIDGEKDQNNLGLSFEALTEPSRNLNSLPNSGKPSEGTEASADATRTTRDTILRVEPYQSFAANPLTQANRLSEWQARRGTPGHDDMLYERFTVL